MGGYETPNSKNQTSNKLKTFNRASSIGLILTLPQGVPEGLNMNSRGREPTDRWGDTFDPLRGRTFWRNDHRGFAPTAIHVKALRAFEEGRCHKMRPAVFNRGFNSANGHFNEPLK